MKTKIILKKGYTLTVTSWENDGNHYTTKSITVDTEENAIALRGLILLSDHSTARTDMGIGNLQNWTPTHEKLVVDYIKSHPEVIPSTWDCGRDVENWSTDDLLDAWAELVYDLMGSSEYYVSRVHETSYIVYSDKDVELELIQGD